MDRRRSTTDQQQQTLSSFCLSATAESAQEHANHLMQMHSNVIHHHPLAVVRYAPQTTRVVELTLTNPSTTLFGTGMQNSRTSSTSTPHISSVIKSVLIPQSSHQKATPAAITLSLPSTNSTRAFLLSKLRHPPFIRPQSKKEAAAAKKQSCRHGVHL